MEFSIERSAEVLGNTPVVLESFLGNLSNDWLRNNEGVDTWSPYDILGHLIHGENTDWMPRLDIILGDQENKTFEPYDRFAQFREDQSRSVKILLQEFKTLRTANLKRLNALNLKASDLESTGFHPDFGAVRLRMLLAAWVVHDLGHIAQISRVMAHQYKEEVGPWIHYMGILKKR